MAVHAGIVLRRHAKPTQVTIAPKDVRENPGRAFRELLMGCFWVSDYTVDFTSRGHYGSIENHFQTGKYSYNIQTIIPESKRDLLRDVTVARDVQYYGYEGATEVPLADARRGEFSSIYIPEERISDLLPYTVIFGGLVDSSEPLQPLFVGREAEELLRDEMHREGMSIYSRR